MRKKLLFCFLFILVLIMNAPSATHAFQSQKPNEVITGGPKTTNSAASLLHDGRVMLTGGDRNLGESCGHSRVNFFDPESGTWTSGPDMPKRLQSHAQVTLADGRVLVTGGLHYGLLDEWGFCWRTPDMNNNTMKTHKSSYIYNPATNTWTTARDMPLTVGNHTLLLLPDGKVLAVGGHYYTIASDGMSGGTESRNAYWVYNPATNTWSSNPTIPAKVPSSYESTYYVETRGYTKLNDGGIFYVARSNVAAKWGPVQNEWKRLTHPTGRYPNISSNHSALPNDNVYIHKSGPASLMYSKLEDDWIDVNGPPEPRDRFESKMLTLNDGRLFLTGATEQVDGQSRLSDKTFLYSVSTFPELSLTPKLGQEISSSNKNLELFDKSGENKTSSTDIGLELRFYYRINGNAETEGKEVDDTKVLIADGNWQNLPDDWHTITLSDEEIQNLNLGKNTVHVWVENNYGAKSTIQSFEFTTPIKDKPISDLSPGQTIDFGGREWIVLDPKTGYIVSKLPINDLTGQPRMMPFDTGGVNLYDPDREQNIAHYLNNEFYDNFTDIEKKVIVDRNWNLTHQDRTNRSGVNDRRDYVSAKVGLLQLDDWIVYSKRFNASRGVLANPPKNVWTLTPRTNYSNQQYYITTAGATSTSTVTSATGAILPAMYIYPNTSLAGITSGGSFIINDSNYKDGAKLANTKAGDYVTFGDEDWIVLDPGSGYMVKKQPIFNEDGTYHITPFDSANRNNFDPNKENTLAYYLNHEYLNTFTELEKESIATAHWNIADNQRTGNTSTPNDYIAAKIGLLTNDDWIAYSKHYNANGRGVLENQPHDFWLLTPYTSNSTRNWYAGANGILNYQTSNSNIPMTLPAIHLKSNLFIASGNGSEDDPYELSLEQQARIVVENQSEKQVVSENSLVRLKVSVEGAPSAPISYQVYKNSKEQPVSCASCSGSGTGEINERILMIEPTQFEEGSTILIQFLAEGAGIGGANIQKEIKLKVDSTGQFDPSDL